MRPIDRMDIAARTWVTAALGLVWGLLRANPAAWASGRPSCWTGSNGKVTGIRDVMFARHAMEGAEISLGPE